MALLEVSNLGIAFGGLQPLRSSIFPLKRVICTAICTTVMSLVSSSSLAISSFSFVGQIR